MPTPNASASSRSRLLVGSNARQGERSRLSGVSWASWASFAGSPIPDVSEARCMGTHYSCTAGSLCCPCETSLIPGMGQSGALQNCSEMAGNLRHLLTAYTDSTTSDTTDTTDTTHLDSTTTAALLYPYRL